MPMNVEWVENQIAAAKTHKQAAIRAGSEPQIRYWSGYLDCLKSAWRQVVKI